MLVSILGFSPCAEIEVDLLIDVETMDTDSIRELVSAHISLEQDKERENEKRDEGGFEEIGVNTNEPIEWIEEDSDEDDARTELGIVIRIWTRRNINQAAFVATMTNIWQTKADLEIKNIGKNLYVVQFHHWKDKQRVMEGQPWHFDKHVILMADIKGNCKPSDIKLWEFPIWTRVYDLPFKGRLNVDNVMAIGNKIGRFIKMDNSGAVGIDKSVRIRVLHDVRNPLVTCVNVKMKNGKEEAFVVKYERPPLFCFFCGRVGHGTKDCDMDDDVDEGEVKFGGWLRASPWKVGNLGDKDHGRAGENSCARALFVTKPKAQPKRDIKADVREMVNRIDNWALKESSKVTNEGREEEKSDRDTTDARGEGKDVLKKASITEAESAGVNDPISLRGQTDKLPQKAEVYGRKVKIWRQIERTDSRSKPESAQASGCKRDEREGMVNGLDAMEIEERRYLKRVSIIDNLALEMDKGAADEKVAGPTEWTLGDQ